MNGDIYRLEIERTPNWSVIELESIPSQYIILTESRMESMDHLRRWVTMSGRIARYLTPILICNLGFVFDNQKFKNSSACPTI